jgi:hypothetical protein
MAETPTGLTPGPASPEPMNFGGGGFRTPAIDPTDGMPEQSQNLLFRLQQRSKDAHAIVPPFSEVQEASTARILAQQRLQTLQGHPAEFGHNLKDDHRSVIEAKKTLQKATAGWTRLNERAEVNAAAWRSASGSVVNCENWAKEGRPGNTVMEYCPTEPPKPAKGDSLLDLIEKLRRRGRELQADANRISSAQFPAAFVKAKMRETILRLSEAGCPNISGMVEHDGPLTFAQSRIQTTLYGDNHSQQISFGETTDAIAFDCWLHRDEIIKRLEKQIDAEVDPNSTPLSYEQREQRKAEIALDLLDIERQEAAAVWLAQEHGLPVEHRADCSPQAILQIQLRTVTGNGHDGPSTTPFAYDIVRSGR